LIYYSIKVGWCGEEVSATRFELFILDRIVDRSDLDDFGPDVVGSKYETS